MGERRRSAKAFLIDHPMCCFCGGKTPATTIDHQPARSLFDRKQWPEGYAFPACDSCNQSSKHYENVLALLVRIGDESSEDVIRRTEFSRYLQAMRNNFPSLLKILSTPEKRKFFKNESLIKPPNIPYHELPMVGMRSDLSAIAIEAVGEKLLRALHYKHTRSIAPKDAGIFFRWFTNAYSHLTTEMKDIVNALGGRPEIIRNRQDLSDQFFYVYGIDQTAKFSAYVIFFRASIAALGMLSFDPSDMPVDKRFRRSNLILSDGDLEPGNT